MKKIKDDLAFAEKKTITSLYKKRANVTESLHPVILLIYFAGMAAITMVTLNPVLLCVSFFGAVFCTGMLTGLRKLLSSLAFSVPVMVIIAVINPIFVHKGETILFFLNDNPVTLEAIMYGAATAVMIMSVFYWFKCYSIVMTSDKIVFLFGRVAPRISLVLSMTLAFVPKLIKQYKKISAVQKAMGMYTSKSITDRILSRFRIISALIGWALESSVETADSMNARGYGLKGRSSYAVYFWTRRDMSVFIFLILVFAAVITGMCFSAQTAYYPVFTAIDISPVSLVSYAALALLSMFAAVFEVQENIKWRLSVSRV